jgi:hypothetical protein
MNLFKKIFNILPITLSLFFLTLLLPSTVNAAQFHFKSYTLPPEEIVNEDIYVFGDNIKIDGVINGDLIAIGDVVQVNGTITGDVYLVGTKVDVTANIYGLLFTFSNNTTINGIITQNVYSFSSFLNFNADTEKDVFAFYLESNIKGSVGDDLRATGVRSNIDAIVRGDLVLLGNQSHNAEEKVTGTIYYNSTIENIARQQGVEIDRIFNVEKPKLKDEWSVKTLMVFINFLSMAFVGFIIITLSPVKTIEIRKKVTDSTDDFLKSLALGIVIAILIPVPLFILFISVIGTPAAIFITGLLSFLLIFGRVWVETAFGKEILELFGVTEYRPFKSFLIGRVLSTIVSTIPVISAFYYTILSLVALGAVIRMKKGYYKMANKQAETFRKKKVVPNK